MFQYPVQITAALCLALAAFAAQADITVQESVSMDGAGMMGMAAMSGKTTTSIAGKRARTDSDMQMKSSMMRLFAGGQTAEITRLDDGKVYELNIKKKTYTESSLAERRAQLQQAMDQAAKGRESQQKAAAPVDQDKCEWSDPKSEFKKTGEKATIAGFEAERATLTVTQSCKLKDTGEVCDYGLALDQWSSSKFEGSAEREAYYKAYAEQMGLGTVGSRDFAQNAQSMFAGYKGLWAEVAKKASSFKGYPLRSTFALAIGGAQCKSAQSSSASGGTTTPAQNAMATAGEIGNAIGGLFGKKSSAPQPAAATAPAPALLINGLVPMMSISSELVSISHDAVPADSFEPPADFKKVEKN